MVPLFLRDPHRETTIGIFVGEYFGIARGIFIGGYIGIGVKSGLI